MCITFAGRENRQRSGDQAEAARVETKPRCPECPRGGVMLLGRLCLCV